MTVDVGCTARSRTIVLSFAFFVVVRRVQQICNERVEVVIGNFIDDNIIRIQRRKRDLSVVWFGFQFHS